jgi:hypothetical protein
VLTFKIKNNMPSGFLTLDGGAHACIQSVDVYFGSTHISSIGGYNKLFQVVQSFTTDLDSLRSSGTVRGIADYETEALITDATADEAYYSKVGADIDFGQTLTVALPLMSVLGTLSMKAIPLSALSDSIRLEIKLANGLDWATYSVAPAAAALPSISDVKLHVNIAKIDGAVERALYSSLGGVIHIPTMDYEHFSSVIPANNGAISFQIPIRVSSASAVIVTLRPTANSEVFNQSGVFVRAKAGMENYRFRVGSMVIPQSAVDCTGSAAEARLELMRVFGPVNDSSPRSCVSGAQYINDSFAVGLNLAAFPSTNALSDGLSTRNQHIVFEAKLAAAHVACILDVWVQHEKLLVAQGGLLTYEA